MPSICCRTACPCERTPGQPPPGPMQGPPEKFPSPAALAPRMFSPLKVASRRRELPHASRRGDAIAVSSCTETYSQSGDSLMKSPMYPWNSPGIGRAASNKFRMVNDSLSYKIEKVPDRQPKPIAAEIYGIPFSGISLGSPQ